MTYLIRPVRPGVTPHAYLRAAWAGRRRLIAGVMVHATRSGTPGTKDGPGTENWLGHPSNTQAVSSSWDSLFWDDGTQVQFGDRDNSFPTWCAGYGDAGTWNAGLYYLQYELAQGTIDTPFADSTIDSLAQQVARDAARYGFPIVQLPYVSQTGPVPRGITAHDNCANGRRLGKSDPGYLFPWAEFIERANTYLTPEEADMTPDEVRALITEALAAHPDDDVDDRLREVMAWRIAGQQVFWDPDSAVVERAYHALAAAGLIKEGS